MNIKNKPNYFELGNVGCSYGEMWAANWCDTCYRDKWKCAIYRDANAGITRRELVYNEEDDPICTKYKSKAEHVVKHRENKEQTTIDFGEGRDK